MRLPRLSGKAALAAALATGAITIAMPAGRVEASQQAQRGQQARRAPGRAATAHPQWLVGRWSDGGCNTEGAVIYRANGTFTTDAGEGRWRLEGNTLIETMLRTNDGEYGAPMEVDRNPSTTRARILLVRPNGSFFRVRYPDGQVYNMDRCR